MLGSMVPFVLGTVIAQGRVESGGVVEGDPLCDLSLRY